MDGFKLISKYRKQIMGTAAVLILFFHCWSPLSLGVPVIGKLVGFIKTNGYLGVDVFLFISGFGVIYSIEKQSVGKYYINRLVRIFPAFIIVAAVYCGMAHLGIKAFIKIITGYSFYFESIFTFLWYITGIISLYVVFPLYYLIMKRFKNYKVFTALAIMIWFVLTMLLKDVVRNDLFGFTDRIPVFLLGVLAGKISKEEEHSFSVGAWAAAFMVMLLGLVCVYLYMYKGVEFIVPMSGCFIPCVLFAVPFAFLVALVCELCSKSAFMQGVGRVLSFFGIISYELYCVQEFTANYLRGLINGRLNQLIQNIVLVMAAVLVGTTLYFLCNAHKLLKRK